MCPISCVLAVYISYVLYKSVSVVQARLRILYNSASCTFLLLMLYKSACVLYKRAFIYCTIVSVVLVQTCLYVFVYVHASQTSVPFRAYQRTHRLIDRKLENNSDSFFGFRPWPLRKLADIADKVDTKSVSELKPRSYRNIVFSLTSYPVVNYLLFSLIFFHSFSFPSFLFVFFIIVFCCLITLFIFYFSPSLMISE